MCKIATFRLNSGTIRALDTYVSQFSFDSRSELLSLIITWGVYYVAAGELRIKGRITGKTAVVGCRLPGNVLDMAKNSYSKRFNDTLSVWLALIVEAWLYRVAADNKRYLKLDKKRGTYGIYSQWCNSFARKFRYSCANSEPKLPQFSFNN